MVFTYFSTAREERQTAARMLFTARFVHCRGQSHERISHKQSSNKDKQLRTLAAQLVQSIPGWVRDQRPESEIFRHDFAMTPNKPIAMARPARWMTPRRMR
ncbi:MAG: hypothetical protein FWF20_00455 [Betaproteobacteria bacterium]|nr:hypothetical protein [Betaproteobacteria bacterium]MCL2885250.1 hypothetical protein [Betaproteobacteria bacterium]